jgi:hypothetical protein
LVWRFVYSPPPFFFLSLFSPFLREVARAMVRVCACVCVCVCV